MKSTPRSFHALALICASAFAAFALFTPVPAPAQQAQANAKALFDEGVKLFDERRYAEAIMKFQQVQRLAPNYVYARSYEARARAALAQGAGPDNRLESQLQKVIIPEIDFREAPLGDILDYFALRAEELTGGELRPNFIFKGTPEQRRDTLVTLTLRNVPMTEAIRYVGQLSRTRFTYDAHAVVAEPIDSSSQQQATGAPSAQSSSAPEGGSEEPQGPRTLFERP